MLYTHTRVSTYIYIIYIFYIKHMRVVCSPVMTKASVSLAERTVVSRVLGRQFTKRVARSRSLFFLCVCERERESACVCECYMVAFASTGKGGCAVGASKRDVTWRPCRSPDPHIDRDHRPPPQPLFQMRCVDARLTLKRG